MKHFLFLIGIALIVVSCNSGKNQSLTQANDSSNSARTASAQQAPDEWTLNGYTKVDAGTMIERFLGKPVLGKPGTGLGVYNKAARTNIWFSIDYLDKLLTMLEEEKKMDEASASKDTVDGVRVYFAKEPGGYGFILVSTHGNKKDGIHKDYFGHNSPYFKSTSAKGIIDRDAKDVGARLYTLTEADCSNVADHCHPGQHFVKCSDAREWVINHNPTDKKDVFNTKSEWFELGLLREIRNDLHASRPGREPDGIRLYYARKKNKDHSLERHHFIIVTTEKIKSPKGIIHQDYFDCPFEKLNASDNGEQCESVCAGTTTW